MTSDAAPDAEAQAGTDSMYDFDTLFDMSAPQPNYKTLLEQSGVVTPMEGFAFSFKLAAVVIATEPVSRSTPTAWTPPTARLAPLGSN